MRLVLVLYWLPLAAFAQVSGSESRFGVPTFYWATAADRGAAPHLGVEQAARRHLEAHAELYRSTPARLAAAVVTGVHDLHDSTAIIVTFQQRPDGVRVFRDEVKVVMNRKLELIAISGFLTPFTRRLGTFALRPESALISAQQHFTQAHLAPAPRSSRLLEGGYTGWQLEGARSVRTRPVYFPLPEGLVPAFYGELELARGWFSFVVSAVDGAVLYEKDLTASHRYAVWADSTTLVPWPGPHGPAAVPHPTGAPNGFSPAPQPQQLVTLEHAGLSTGDPWLLAGAMETRGNNVDAYADVSLPGGYNSPGDVLGLVSSPESFEWTYDFSVHPSGSTSQTRAAITQLFYTTNFLHDWFYDDGFTEVAGNAQLQNFGRGGLGSDLLRAEAQDRSGSFNANMATPADGQSPRMQMYLFASQWLTIKRDGTIDNGIVAHEWGHYISNRLVGDSNGLSTHQSYGMGEGWGDFHAALLLVDAADSLAPGNTNWDGAFSLSAWAMLPLEPNASYFGIRRFPLSTSFARNPLTFRHIGDGVPLPTGAPIAPGYFGSNSEVHNAGEVWALMLWECYVELLRDPRLSFQEAQARMKRYLVAAYKATPLMPTYTEGRDALLSVAAANDPLDFVHFWEAFARRGLGRGAVAPDRYNVYNFPLVESFSVGNEAQLLSIALEDSTQSCDQDGVLDRDEVGLLTVQVRNIGTTALSGATLSVASANTALSFPSGTSFPLPTLAAFSKVAMEIPVTLTGGLGVQTGDFDLSVTGASLGPTGTTGTASFRLNSDEKLANSQLDSVETAATVWTPGADQSLDRDSGFRRVEATITQHFWRAPSPSTAADSWLISPPLQVGSAPFRLTFNHRHEFELSGMELLDGAVIELSTDDGATWNDVGAQASPGYTGTLSTLNGTNPLQGRRAFTGRSPRYPAFSSQTLDFGTTYANRTVRLRFRVGGDDGSDTPTRGWELDDLQFFGLLNTPFGSLVADANACSNQPPVASAGPDLTVGEGVRVVLLGSATDPDGDPVTLTWAQTSGPLGVLIGNAFTTPEVTSDTTLTLELTANDGRVDSAPALLRVLVRNFNRTPVASAPRSAEGNSGERVVVKGTGSDSDGEALTFEWTQVSGPTTTLEGAMTDTVALVLPEVEGTQTLELQLIVRDASASSTPALTTITVHGPVKEEPKPEPKGCGCSTAEAAALGLLLAFLARRWNR